MTNHKLMKRVVIAAEICLIAVAGLGIAGTGSRPWQQPATQQPSAEEIIALRKALRRGGLREAAKLKGNYIAEYNPHWEWGRFDLETLTKGSAAVIVARFKKKGEPRLLDGMVIFTDYEVSVDELVKGDIRQGETIVVTLPGGRISFEDGTSAEQTTPSFEHPHIGPSYALFLMREAAVPSVFFLAGGPQGMFDLEDSSGVKSHGLPDDLTAVETKGKSREALMNTVREQAENGPSLANAVTDASHELISRLASAKG